MKFGAQSGDRAAAKESAKLRPGVRAFLLAKRDCFYRKWRAIRE